MDAVTIDFFEDRTFRAEVLIEGLPGIGHVGKLVAEHLIHELGARKLAEGEHRIAFLVGDYQSTSGEGHYVLAETYLDVAQQMEVRRIYALGGYGVGHLVDVPRVLCAVNRPELRGDVEAAGGEFKEDEPAGGIIGASGLLVGLARRRSIDAVCLMGETSGYLVDPKSATSLLRVLSTLLGIEVDSTQLQDRAAEMEQVIERLAEIHQARQDDELSYIG
jgi:uncharacterized protein (TIGR00162 family)